jgi:hypothetical protein
LNCIPKFRVLEEISEVFTLGLKLSSLGGKLSASALVLNAVESVNSTGNRTTIETNTSAT